MPCLFRELLQFFEANTGLGITFRETTADFSKLQYKSPLFSALLIIYAIKLLETGLLIREIFF